MPIVWERDPALSCQANEQQRRAVSELALAYASFETAEVKRNHTSQRLIDLVDVCMLPYLAAWSADTAINSATSAASWRHIADAWCHYGDAAPSSAQTEQTAAEAMCQPLSTDEEPLSPQVESSEERRLARHPSWPPQACTLTMHKGSEFGSTMETGYMTI